MKRHGDFEDEVERKIQRTEERSDNTLAVTPIESLYSEPLPSFRRPVEIGHFSLDVDRKFHDDNHQLKYFCPPHTIKFDLAVGYKDFVARDDDVKERLDHLLMWVDKHKDKFELPKKESVENGQAAASSSSLSTR
jgi:RAT1-interacting protein